MSDELSTVQHLQHAVEAAQTQLVQFGQALAAAAPAVTDVERRIHQLEQRALKAEQRAAKTENQLEQSKRAAVADQRLVAAALAFLVRIDDISTEGFARGEERTEREALRDILEDLGAFELQEVIGEQ